MSQSISELAEELASRNEEKLALEKRVRDLRNEYFTRLSNEVDVHSLPKRTIEIPNRFWRRTGMSIDAFVESRFPTYELLTVKHSPEITTLVLQKLPDFMANTVTGQGYQTARIVPEPTPELDYDTISREFPLLAKRLFKPVVKYVPDEEAIVRLINEHPEVMSIIPRHVKVNKPSVKLNARFK